MSMGGNPIKNNDPQGNLTDGYENSKGLIIFNDKTDASYKDEKGTVWKNIGKENNPDWNQNKQINFLKAQNLYQEKEIKSLEKQIAIWKPAFDIVTSILPVTAIFTLISGTNPATMDKVDNVDKGLAAVTLFAPMLNILNYVKVVKTTKQVNNVVKVIDATNTGTGTAKTIYDAKK